MGLGQSLRPPVALAMRGLSGSRFGFTASDSCLTLIVCSILQQPGADPSSSYKYRYRPYDLDVVTRKQVRCCLPAQTLDLLQCSVCEHVLACGLRASALTVSVVPIRALARRHRDADGSLLLPGALGVLHRLRDGRGALQARGAQRVHLPRRVVRSLISKTSYSLAWFSCVVRASCA